MVRRPRQARRGQLSLRLARPPEKPTRGGARPGAGRPRRRALPQGWKLGRAFVPHLRREVIDARSPAHVTLRLQRVARTLRNGKLHAVVHAALTRAASRPGFRVVHYSLQRDHLHLIVEADRRQTLARGMQGLNVSLARRLNHALDRSGAALADRYHARVLRSPTAVRHALLYVLNNARHHAAQESATYPRAWLDPYSSAHHFAGWCRAIAPDPTCPPLPCCTAPPASWLLRSGWRRARGALDPAAVPGSTPPPGLAD